MAEKPEMQRSSVRKRGKEKVDQSRHSASSKKSRHSATDATSLDSWLDNVWEKIFASKRRSSHGRAPCTIYEVPVNIRKHDPQAYQPTLVAIGPYHRKLPGLLVTDGDKWRCIRYLLCNYSPTINMDKLLRSWIENIKQKEELAWSCYSRDDDMDSYSFMEMLLLDGCFILHVLLMILQKKEIEETREPSAEGSNSGYANKDDEENPLVSMLWQWKLLKLDLLLLENQIPFFIIQDLFNQIADPRIKHISVACLALELFNELYPGKKNGFRREDDFSLYVTYGTEILHLLHLFHSALLRSSDYGMVDTEGPCWNHFSSHSSMIIAQLQIPSATELAESAVQFKNAGLARSFLDIAFDNNGVLEIPALYISDHSNALFRNLIAFEQCYPGVTPKITAYTTFMECIMHGERDVRLLHQSGAIVNMLSTDEDVAIFFKQICYQVDRPHISHYLSPLCERVVVHHKSQWPRWNAELKRRYFSNPWVVVSVFAAASLFCLTFIQTLYTVLGYYNHK